MLKVNLGYYIEKYNLNINQLSKETGLSRKAITLLMNYNKEEEPPVSLQYNTIDTLCRYFNIGVGSLIQYVYDMNNFQVFPISPRLDENIFISSLVYSKEINGSTSHNFLSFLSKVEYTEGRKETLRLPKTFLGSKENKELNLKELDDNGIEYEERIVDIGGVTTINYELIEKKDLALLKKHIIGSFFEQLNRDEFLLMENFEIISLFKSFNKSFLAELSAKSFDYLLDFEKIKKNDRAIVEWNVGEYGWTNEGTFHFEYMIMDSKENDFSIISLDSDQTDEEMYGSLGKSMVRPIFSKLI